MAVIEHHGADTPGLLTPAQVAAILQVSPRTVRRLNAQGVLPGVRLGHRTVRFTSESVEALIAPTTNNGAPARGAAAKTREDTAHAKPT